MPKTVHRIAIIMNSLMRSIVEIIKQGGVKISPSEFIMPDPVLVGRDAIKLEKLGSQSGVKKFTTDLDAVLRDPSYQIYFDAQTTGRRAEGVRQAVKAGKHVYCEKPTAASTETAMEL